MPNGKSQEYRGDNPSAQRGVDLRFTSPDWNEAFFSRLETRRADEIRKVALSKRDVNWEDIKIALNLHKRFIKLARASV